jgi:hypothetical protein
MCFFNPDFQMNMHFSLKARTNLRTISLFGKNYFKNKIESPNWRENAFAGFLKGGLKRAVQVTGQKKTARGRLCDF